MEGAAIKEGFLLVDKPKGVPSFRSVSVLRRLTGMKRIGFAGTLDPLASGLLILAVGRSATKQLGLLSKMDKVYDVKIELGKISNTYDADGEIECINNLDIKSLKAILSKKYIQQVIDDNFSGERLQVPPIFSAIHVAGKRAYDLARRNKKVELKPRKVIFHSVEILSFNWPFLELRVHCGSGTYIRSLAHDLGNFLECGGYIKELRRIKVGHLSVDDAVHLDSINSENVFGLLRPTLL